MNLATVFLLLSYSITILSLIWGRFFFFKIKSKSSKLGSIFYDPAVIIQLSITTYTFTSLTQQANPIFIVCIGLYLLGLSLFWWAISTSKHFEFAFSSNIKELIFDGPFAYVRHPFYLAYFSIWLSNTLATNSILLWITLLYLTAFYITSAKTEEKAILDSEYSKEYRTYSQNVGMFLPRITLWKN